MPTFGSITFIPAIHQRMAFADLVRRACVEATFDVIAVEAPPALETWFVRGVMRLPQLSAVCYPAGGGDDEGEMFYLPIDPSDAMIEAARIALENEIELKLIDGGFDPTQKLPGPHDFDLPDDLMLNTVPLEQYLETVLPYFRMADPNGPLGASVVRERWMAQALEALSAGGRRVLCVLGLAHLDGVMRHLEVSAAFADAFAAEAAKKAAETGAAAPPVAEPPPPPAYPAPVAASPPGAFLSHLKRESLPEVLREIPYLAYLRESDREGWEFERAWRFDKMDALIAAYRQAEAIYAAKHDFPIGIPRHKAMIQFARNMAFIRGRLQPDAYTAVMAAKGTVDGDYAWEVHALLRSFPSQDAKSPLPGLKIRRGRGIFTDRERKFRMFSANPAPEMAEVKIGLRRRPSAEELQRFRENSQWNPRLGLCSWPPEDERQEKFMMFLRRRALEILSEDKRQTLEFSTSFLDGLDIRETMRNWHTGKLYVHSKPQPQGQVGAVVIVFDDEPIESAKYPWRTTLYAENQNESDISFYSTSMMDDVVGPRIYKVRFGGLLSIYPANHIPDVWGFPGVESLGSCGEALLAGGIVFSDHKYVAHVAARPPSAPLRELAARHGKRIVHIPIRSLAEATLKKMRVFHILNGRDARGFAADYIFE